jgi:hypothetical protein
VSIQQWAINAGAKGIIKDAEKDGRIAEAVTLADATIKGFFPGDEKSIKQQLVQYVIFPFCKLFLKDDPEGYAKAKAGL